MSIDEKTLIERAIRVRLEAYAPYSGFRVGAALLSDDGRVFTGVNIENASYGLSMCAERVAVGSAIAGDCRSFEAIAIAIDGEAPCPPCGACRQVLAEFSPEADVIMTNLKGDVLRIKVKELLPHAFTNRQLFQNK